MFKLILNVVIVVFIFFVEVAYVNCIKRNDDDDDDERVAGLQEPHDLYSQLMDREARHAPTQAKQPWSTLPVGLPVNHQLDLAAAAAASNHSTGLPLYSTSARRYGRQHASYGHGKSWNFSKSWKMERVMEKSWNVVFGKKFLSCKNKQDRWKICF